MDRDVEPARVLHAAQVQDLRAGRGEFQHLLISDPVQLADVGVAGVHRLLDNLALFDDCCALIVVAGMEGALPSIVAGLVQQPVVGVPTSVGYGVATGGTAAMHAMLASCAPGIAVMNVDNGFGAACFAHKVALASRR